MSNMPLYYKLNWPYHTINFFPIYQFTWKTSDKTLPTPAAQFLNTFLNGETFFKIFLRSKFQGYEKSFLFYSCK